MIRVKWWALPLFQWHAFRSGSQAYQTKGLISMKAWRHHTLVFCTFTLWETEEAMLNFRNNGAHLKAMKLTRKMSDYASAVSWKCEERPSQEEVKRRLVKGFEIGLT